jgi:hypothetical protein
VWNLVLSPDLGINDKQAILASFRAETARAGLALVARTQQHDPLQPDEIDIRGARRYQQNGKM